MFGLTDLLIKAALNLPDESRITFNYFLKDFQTEAWYWLFRAIFLLGLVTSILVFLYYRRRPRLHPEHPATEAEQNSEPPGSSRPAGTDSLRLY